MVSEDSARRAALGQKLMDLGVWQNCSPGEQRRQSEQVARGEWPLSLPVFEDVQFFADGEDLAEGAVEEVLSQMAPALRQHGVDLRVRTLATPTSTHEPYVVEINQRQCLVWDPGDWTDYQAWEDATLRPLRIVDELLQAADASVRVYTLAAGGNDGVAFLLDPRVVTAMRDSGCFKDKDIPRTVHQQ
jgi:hypothetical protein